MRCNNRLIVALDFSDMESVKSLVEKLGDTVKFYKVGMELFYSVGVEVIEYLRTLNKEIFLDLKLHDIPNTVAKGLSSLTRLGVSMLNVHASGGPAMLEAAAHAVKAEAEKLGVPRPKLIAVTVLTSINQAEWSALGQSSDIADQVVRLSRLAKASGIDGVVASPQEATLIKRECGEDFLIVTPGVRPKGAALNDQSRVATPLGALNAGASHLVVGRPITAASNPREAAELILQEMEGFKDE
ncbi:orotidine-5'-phosphate decarboxylase [Dendrosporobacter sp. 1207_IL3150]|uniref:orotidine-5'-phosphate decarboxylase n=1 Tax=Dendrosporobacter sp. 1207_IL3150 TaxID=3084054 RepID=UPI002FD93669